MEQYFVKSYQELSVSAAFQAKPISYFCKQCLVVECRLMTVTGEESQGRNAVQPLCLSYSLICLKTLAGLREARQTERTFLFNSTSTDSGSACQRANQRW